MDNSKQSTMQQVRTLLQSGRLNEAFAESVKSMPFHLENLEFIELLVRSLRELGFLEEASSIGNFLTQYVEFRQSEVQKYTEDIGQAQELGHSEGYKLEGPHTHWSDPYWEKRALILGQVVPEGQSILDLGCGNMLIEKHLKNLTKYTPCDIKSRDDRTIVCNFDLFQYPDASSESIVVCLGVLNYLEHQKELLNFIFELNKPFFLSFKPFDLIKHKVSSGVFPAVLGFNETIKLISSHEFDVRYKYLMGQGDEVLFVGTPKAS